MIYMIQGVLIFYIILTSAYMNAYSKHLVIQCIKYLHKKTGNVNYYLSNTSFAKIIPEHGTKLKYMT